MISDNNSGISTRDEKSKIVMIQHVVSALEVINNQHLDMLKEIKEKLAIEMARKLLDENLILFTKETQHDNYETIFRARCYLANREDVAIIANIK